MTCRVREKKCAFAVRTVRRSVVRNRPHCSHDHVAEKCEILPSLHRLNDHVHPVLSRMAHAEIFLAKLKCVTPAQTSGRMSCSNLEQRVPSGPLCATSGARNHSNHRIKVVTRAMGRSLVTFLGVRKNVVVQQVVAISHTAQPSRRISQILSPCFSWFVWRNFSVETCHGSLRLPSASLQTLSFQPWQP